MVVTHTTSVCQCSIGGIENECFLVTNLDNHRTDPILQRPIEKSMDVQGSLDITTISCLIISMPTINDMDGYGLRLQSS